jgi:hypothetical protein
VTRFACLLLLALPLGAAEKRWATSSDSRLTLGGGYAFRGARVVPGVGLLRESRNAVRPVPRLELSLASTSFWRTEADWRNVESRYAFALAARPLDKLTVEAGWCYRGRLDWTGTGLSTAEVFAGARHEGPGRPSARLWYGYRAPVGAYLECSAGHTWNLARRVKLGVDATVGFDPGRRVEGFHDARLRAGLPIRLWRDWHLCPQLRLVVPAARVDSGGARLLPELSLVSGRPW